jgi:membrane protein
MDQPTASDFTFKAVAKSTWAEIRADDVIGRAAQLAYYFFLALFPFLIAVVAMLSVFGRADRGRAVLFAIFARFLPAEAFQLISQTFADLLKASGPLKMSFGILFSIFSASMGMNAAIDTLNAAYGVKESRSFFRQYAVSIALTCGLGLLLTVSLLAATIIDSLVAPLPFAYGVAWRVLKWPCAIALLVVAFALVYNFAPDMRERRWRWITPGSIFGITVLLVVSFGVRVYVRYFANYTTTYGSLGAVIILLLCFYLIGIAMLTGGTLNAVLERQPASTPSEKLPASDSQKLAGLRKR